MQKFSKSYPEYDNYCRQSFMKNFLSCGLDASGGIGPQKFSQFFLIHLPGQLEEDFFQLGTVIALPQSFGTLLDNESTPIQNTHSITKALCMTQNMCGHENRGSPVT